MSGAVDEQGNRQEDGQGINADRRSRNCPVNISVGHGMCWSSFALVCARDFHHRALVSSLFQGFGPKRIVRDLLNMPGRLVF